MDRYALRMATPPRPRPTRDLHAGRYVRLEPLSDGHAPTLFAASSGSGTDERFAFLFDAPPADESALIDWIHTRSKLDDSLFFAVIDARSGRAEGRLALMRVTPEHGVIEVGSILFGPRIARTRIATEAIYLLARHVFDDLGYRRFEWKCDDANEASKRAAIRFGFRFEGVFRQHMWTKRGNRDTAWFAMIDRDWPNLRAEYERWLAPGNFTADGSQRTPLRVPGSGG